MSSDTPSISPRLRTSGSVIAPVVVSPERQQPAEMKVLLRLPHVATAAQPRWKLALARSLLSKAQQKYAVAALGVFAVCLVLIVSHSRRHQQPEPQGGDAPIWHGADNPVAPAISAKPVIPTTVTAQIPAGPQQWDRASSAPEIAGAHRAPEADKSHDAEQHGPALGASNRPTPSNNWPPLAGQAHAESDVPTMPAHDPSPALMAQRPTSPRDAAADRAVQNPAPGAWMAPAKQAAGELAGDAARAVTAGVEQAAGIPAGNQQPGVARFDGTIAPAPAAAPQTDNRPPSRYQ